jgi:hypothetical protein
MLCSMNLFNGDFICKWAYKLIILNCQYGLQLRKIQLSPCIVLGQLGLLTLEALIEEPDISQNPALELMSKNISCHFHFQDHVRFNEEGDFL